MKRHEENFMFQVAGFCSALFQIYGRLKGNSENSSPSKSTSPKVTRLSDFQCLAVYSCVMSRDF